MCSPTYIDLFFVMATNVRIISQCFFYETCLKIIHPCYLCIHSFIEQIFIKKQLYTRYYSWCTVNKMG